MPRGLLLLLLVIIALQGATCLPISRAWNTVSDEMKVAIHNLQMDLQKAAYTFWSHIRKVPIISGQGDPQWINSVVEFFMASFGVHMEKQAETLQEQLEFFMDQLEGIAFELFVVAQSLRSFMFTGVNVDHLKDLFNGVMGFNAGDKPV